MPDGFDDEKLKKFLADESENEALRIERDAIENRFRVFLLERGVSIPEEPELGTPGALEYATLLGLVGRKFLVDHGIESDDETKKELQAKAFALGLTQPWLDLIDTEFSGESLDPDRDAEFIVEQLIAANHDKPRLL